MLFRSDHDDILEGDAGANRLDGGAGDDRLIGGQGADVLVGGDDTDIADYTNASGAVTVDLGAGTGIGSAAQGDTLSQIENVEGSDHNDNLRGDAGVNLLIGGAGNDSLEGAAGADILQGGDGSDTLAGGADADDLQGGAGSDTADYSASGSAVDVSLVSNTGSGGDAAGDTLTDIENLTGSALDDTLTGDAGDNVLTGNAGDDLLIGGAGADDLIGGGNTDTADYSSSATGVLVDLTLGTGAGGDAQGDTLATIENVIGSSSGDTLTGDTASNVLTGDRKSVV